MLLFLVALWPVEAQPKRPQFCLTVNCRYFGVWTCDRVVQKTDKWSACGKNRLNTAWACALTVTAKCKMYKAESNKNLKNVTWIDKYFSRGIRMFAGTLALHKMEVVKKKWSPFVTLIYNKQCKLKIKKKRRLLFDSPSYDCVRYVTCTAWILAQCVSCVVFTTGSWWCHRWAVDAERRWHARNSDPQTEGVWKPDSTSSGVLQVGAEDGVPFLMSCFSSGMMKWSYC